MALSYLVLVAHLAYVCIAQIYELSSLTVPTNKSLETLYAFYVYSHDDAPQKTPFGQPHIKFHRLKATLGATPPPSNVNVSEYAGLQLSIMLYSEFWNLIDPKDFCCTWQEEESGICKEDQLMLRRPIPGEADIDLNFYSFPIGFANEPAKDVIMDVKKTGVYILMFSNCGDLFDATISGDVRLKNAYGFLPGNEFHKMAFYWWLLVVYVALGAVWTLMVVRRWRELYNIQRAIGAVILFGLIESGLWYLLFTDWNSTGHRRNVLFIPCILSSVLKSVFSYMLVLVASLGWGVTKPFLGWATSMQIGALTLAYIVLDFTREVVLSRRHSTTLPMAFVILCLMPVSLLNGGIFYWVFTSLSDLMEVLKDRRQLEKLALFQCLSKLLVCAIVVATGALLMQIYELAQNASGRWEYEWILGDGIPHLIFVVILCAMMYLWSPHKYSERYAHTGFQSSRDVELTADVFSKENFLQTDGSDAKENDILDTIGTSGERRFSDNELAQI